jgi:hypothetical protein
MFWLSSYSPGYSSKIAPLEQVRFHDHPMQHVVDSVINDSKVQGVIVGAILLACFGAYLTWRNGYKARRAAAALRFRSSVLETLTGLYPIPVAWPTTPIHIERILRERFAALQIAVEEYQRYVPFWQRWAFRKAWRRYRLGRDGRDVDHQDYWQYIPYTGSGMENGAVATVDTTTTYKASFKANVERLLGFASEI